jgi:DNA-binding NarL/FixJ family response regulator
MSQAEAGRALDGLRVLLVEDDFLILSGLESLLVDAGAEIVGKCRDVLDAIPLAETAMLSAAILDIRVGRDSAVPIARVLARRGIPVIFYTGQMDGEAVRTEWPQFPIISKPAPPGAIVAAVAEVAKRSR